MIIQNPGEKPAMIGEWIEVDSNGNILPDSKQVTITPDDGHLPPTQKPGRKWRKL
ncbi:hypothetical protein HNP93_001411 [Methanococcus maripaludis]|jgi:hypothetical protein|uniref:Uncharacterized protein n=1 Tax=Methanococcus maripaludis TaxID=39152 RepID=A0A7J9P7D2_METMI|nr:YjzC family protein [Methanococcus maripaludis]MBA2858710.1 hypothetical protein [Methanococcus maripaludis]